MRSPNEIIVDGDIVQIVMYDKNCNESGRTIVDAKYLNLIMKFKWSISEGYVISRTTRKKVWLHRIIMNAPDGTMVDHINHNPLDNRESNLRICSRQQNMMNRKVNKSNSSGHKGVYWHKAVGRWAVQIMINHKRLYLGSFDSLDEAVLVHKKAEEKYFGEFAYKETYAI